MNDAQQNGKGDHPGMPFKGNQTAALKIKVAN